MELISIVIPAFNAERTIGQSIQSVVDQTYTHWELLVVDDASDDGTCDVVREFAVRDSRIRLIGLDENCGAPAVPRNIGVRNANGAWIAFLDSDDIWHPKKLDLQIAVLKKFDKKFCSSKMMDFRDDADIKFPELGKWNVEFITFSKQLRRFRTPTSSVVADKELLLKFPFKADPRYKAREDMECWLKIHEEIGESIKIKFPLIKYRISSEQISSQKIEMARKTLMVLEEYTLKSGDSLKFRKYYYLFCHIYFSIIFRVIKKSL